jgi:hypothetical protein
MDSLNKIKDNIFKSFLVKRNKFISPKFIEEQIEISNNVLSEDRLYIGEEIDLLVFNKHLSFHENYDYNVLKTKHHDELLDREGYYNLEIYGNKKDSSIEIILNFLDEIPDDIGGHEDETAYDRSKSDLVSKLAIDLIHNSMFNEALIVTDEIHYPYFLYLYHYPKMIDAIIINSLRVNNNSLQNQLDLIIDRRVNLCEGPDSLVYNYSLYKDELKARYAEAVFLIKLSREHTEKTLDEKIGYINKNIDDLIDCYINCKEINIAIGEPLDSLENILKVLKNLNLVENEIYLLNKIIGSDSKKILQDVLHGSDKMRLITRYTEFIENPLINEKIIDKLPSIYSTTHGVYEEVLKIASENDEDIYTLGNTFKFLVINYKEDNEVEMEDIIAETHEQIIRLRDGVSLSKRDHLFMSKINLQIFVRKENISLVTSTFKMVSFDFLEESFIWVNNIEQNKTQCKCGKYDRQKDLGLICHNCNTICKSDGARLFAYEEIIQTLKFSSNNEISNPAINQFIDGVKNVEKPEELYFMLFESTINNLGVELEKDLFQNYLNYFNENILMRFVHDKPKEYLKSISSNFNEWAVENLTQTNMLHRGFPDGYSVVGEDNTEYLTSSEDETSMLCQNNDDIWEEVEMIENILQNNKVWDEEMPELGEDFEVITPSSNKIKKFTKFSNEIYHEEDYIKRKISEFLNDNEFKIKFNEMSHKFIEFFIKLLEKRIKPKSNQSDLVKNYLKTLINLDDNIENRSKYYTKVSEIYIGKNLFDDALEFINNSYYQSFEISKLIIDKLGFQKALKFLDKTNLNKDEVSRAIYFYFFLNKPNKEDEFIFLSHFYKSPISNLYFINYLANSYKDDISSKYKNLIEEVIDLSDLENT